MTEKLHIIPQDHPVAKEDRQKLKGHKGMVIWLTGLSGSGKSTIAGRLEQLLMAKGIHTYILDGDNIRAGLNTGLGFSREDRQENLRRIAEVGKLFVDAGIMVLSAFVSPLIKDRKMVKSIIGKANFAEIFINTPLAECERRDVKGLYKKARAGEISDFTGISAPYEAPRHPDLEVKTEGATVDEAAQLVFDYLMKDRNIQQL